MQYESIDIMGLLADFPMRDVPDPREYWREEDWEAYFRDQEMRQAEAERLAAEEEEREREEEQEEREAEAMMEQDPFELRELAEMRARQAEEEARLAKMRATAKAEERRARQWRGRSVEKHEAPEPKRRRQRGGSSTHPLAHQDSLVRAETDLLLAVLDM